jgi:hypothetical protein
VALSAERSRVDIDRLLELVMRTLMVWSTIFDALSFELLGYLTGSVNDVEQAILHLAADLSPA